MTIATDAGSRLSREEREEIRKRAEKHAELVARGEVIFREAAGNDYATDVPALLDALDAVEAEKARYREALEEIVDWLKEEGGEVRTIAEQALSPTSTSA